MEINELKPIYRKRCIKCGEVFIPKDLTYDIYCSECKEKK